MLVADPAPSAGSMASLLAPSVRSGAKAGSISQPFGRKKDKLTACVPISAVVLTLNSERRLREVLEALCWCNEVLVFDTGSKDQTVAIAQSFPNVTLRCLFGPFPGFGITRRAAVAAARNDWILSIDSDEIVSPELRREIMDTPVDPEVIYSMPFHNYFNGKRIVSCGWGNERHERLFHRATVNFGTQALHEGLEHPGHPTVKLKGAVNHYSYDSMDAFLGKMRSYSRLFAQQHAGRRRSSPTKALLRGAWTFFNSYILQGGLIQGAEGLAISAYRAQTAFWKYFLLHEANQGLGR